MSNHSPSKNDFLSRAPLRSELDALCSSASGLVPDTCASLREQAVDAVLKHHGMEKSPRTETLPVHPLKCMFMENPLCARLGEERLKIQDFFLC